MPPSIETSEFCRVEAPHPALSPLKRGRGMKPGDYSSAVPPQVK